MLKRTRAKNIDVQHILKVASWYNYEWSYTLN